MARWFSKDKESSVSGVTGFTGVQYSMAVVEGEGTRNQLKGNVWGHVVLRSSY